MAERNTSGAPSYCGAESVGAVVGAVGTGKTQALVERVEAFLREGGEPGDALVLAAGPAAADALAARIASACGERGRGVRVTTPLSLARTVLADCADAPVLGGRAHVLADFEANFFLEDMRVTGIKQRRLKEMLKFLQRGWSEMREDEEGWLVTGEEVALNDFARSRLAFMGSLVRAEATAACVRLLTSPEGASVLERVRRGLVVADDFGSMSRASQRLAGLLARTCLAVGWDPVGGLAGEEPYGYAAGLDELVRAAEERGARFERVDLAWSMQEEAPARVVGNLFAQECLAGCAACAPRVRPSAGEGSFAVETAGGISGEMGLVAAEVASCLERGMRPDEVFVVAPTEAWARRACDALAAAGVAASRLGTRQAIGGDIRDLSKCAAARAYTALHLAADPRSDAAWRAWCGFGDYLACSVGVSALADRMAQGGPAAAGALARASEGCGADGSVQDVPDARKIAARHAAGERMLEAAAGLRGLDLLALLAREAAGAEDAALPSELAALIGEVGPDETASELFARAERNLLAPTVAPGCVRVGGPDALVGQAPRAVVLCGMVNGLVPSLEYFDASLATIEAQDKMHERLVRRLVDTCGKARERIVCTGFARAGVVECETLRLKGERIRLRGGKRVCEFGPSVAVQYLRGEKLARER